jgi:DNA replication licensing factor MCM7
MEESDRTAIHEVMEQQTVSIAKAGITTTLNARATVIAAANPVFGRYNKRKSVGENLDMPAALLSRFDLVFVMLDKPNRESDLDLARHITMVHRTKKPPTVNNEVFIDAALMRTYIACARMKDPVIPADLQDHIASQYVFMRKATNDAGEGEGRYGNTRERFCTARMLLSILRLGQALARIYMKDVVEISHIEEAIRLITESKNDLLDVPQELSARRMDAKSRVFSIITEMGRAGTVITVDRVTATAGMVSIVSDDVIEAIDHYCASGLLMKSGGDGEIMIVNTESL